MQPPTASRSLAHSSAAQDRLTNSSDEASNTAIAALLARALQLHHGELILQLDPAAQGNLKSRALSSLFDSPDAAVLIDDTALLSKTTVDSIFATFETIATQIGVKVSVLHNPFDDEGKRKEVEGPAGTETASSANDEAHKERWRGKALRLLLRRIGEGAEDINEVRVCVVGNVDAGKSSLLGGERDRDEGTIAEGLADPRRSQFSPKDDSTTAEDERESPSSDTSTRSSQAAPHRSASRCSASLPTVSRCCPRVIRTR